MKLFSLLVVCILPSCAWLADEIHIGPKFDSVESRNKKTLDAMIMVTFGMKPKEEKLEREKTPWEIND